VKIIELPNGAQLVVGDRVFQLLTLLMRQVTPVDVEDISARFNISQSNVAFVVHAARKKLEEESQPYAIYYISDLGYVFDKRASSATEREEIISARSRLRNL
jgi:hypothetical protein